MSTQKYCYKYSPHHDKTEYLHPHDFSEAALQMRFDQKVFWKYAANLQENAHAEEWFQWRNGSFLAPKFSFFKKKFSTSVFSGIMPDDRH